MGQGQHHSALLPQTREPGRSEPTLRLHNWGLAHPSQQPLEVGSAESHATLGETEAQRREVTCPGVMDLELGPITAPSRLWISILS